MTYERSLLIEQRFQTALQLIEAGSFNAKQLANKLDVSPATVQRIVAALKRRGYTIRSVHEGQGWRYEILKKPSTV